jgi:predicted short-subunit dehydrogenase-like oxidoreductase (DUF2520 family)
VKNLQRLRISIIGAGKVGTNIGYHIVKSGLPFAGIFSKRSSSAIRAIRAIGKSRVLSSMRELIPASDIIIIAVNDSEIGNVVKEISREQSLERQEQGIGGLNKKIFIHTCGSLPSSVLFPLVRFGASVASMHPLQTISSSDSGMQSLKGTSFLIEGGKEAVSAARMIARKTGGKALIIDKKDKCAYHLAAAFLSNYIVSLADMALDVIPDVSLSKRELSKIFSPLIEGTARNLRMHGMPDALTGPISRGDIATVRKHLEMLKDESSELRTLHRILARRALRIAVKQKRLSAEKKVLLMRLLGQKS